jgi:16S rRNA (uracil1498-N3)-methyltransferase
MRLYMPDMNAVSDKRVRLDKDQENYVKVRRIEIGEEIVLFNEQDGDWAGILSDGKHVVLQSQKRPVQNLCDLWLIQALIAKDRFAMVAEKSTELGVAALLPVTTRYTQGVNLNLERTQQHMIEASQQCERNVIPELQKTQGLLALLVGWDATRTLYVAMERADAPTAAKVFAPGKAAILIGPEGGFNEEEKEILAQHKSVKFFSLGPRILRAETAAITSLSIWQAIVGDCA